MPVHKGVYRVRRLLCLFQCSQRDIRSGRVDIVTNLPAELPSGLKARLTCTHTAHVDRPYTNARGKYAIEPQQQRSTRLAQLFRRRLKGGDEGDDEGASVAILFQSL